MNLRRRSASEDRPIGLTAMIDVTFLLLIFFLCTLRFRSFEGKLEAFLPRDGGSQRSDVDPPLSLDVHLSVAAEGQRIDRRTGLPSVDPAAPFDLVGRRIALRAGPHRFTGLDGARAFLEGYARRDRERRVVIHAGPGVTHGDVTETLDALLAVGFRDVTFGPRRAR